MAARLFVLFNMIWWFCLDSNSWHQTAVTGTAPPWSIVRQYGFAFLGVRIALHICLDSVSWRRTVVTGFTPSWSIVRQYGFAFLDFRVILLTIGILFFLASPPQGYLKLIRAKMFLASVAHVDSRDGVLAAHSIRETPRAHSGERRRGKSPSNPPTRPTDAGVPRHAESDEA
uniref:Secreted protein n=1 Tax=Ixodes ricinus TaxID=34613 RepID=A0A6B0UYC0_IXORI